MISVSGCKRRALQDIFIQMAQDFWFVLPDFLY